MDTMTDDLKELVRSEVMAKCKAQEEILWRNGKKAFSTLQAESRETNDVLRKKIALLEENLTVVVNQNTCLQSLLMDMGHRVENLAASGSETEKDDSDSTNTIKSTISSGTDFGEKSEHTTPVDPLYESHAPNPQIAPSYEIAQPQPKKAQDHQLAQELQGSKSRGVQQAPPGLDTFGAPEPSHTASKTKNWLEPRKEPGSSTKDAPSAWLPPEGSSGLNSLWNYLKNAPWDDSSDVQWKRTAITMIKSSDAPSLGTDVDKNSDGSLSVETILPGGLVWKYNQHLDKIRGEKISVGDRIYAVNGKTDTSSMLAECKSSAKLLLIVVHRKTAAPPIGSSVLRADARPFEPSRLYHGV